MLGFWTFNSPLSLKKFLWLIINVSGELLTLKKLIKYFLIIVIVVISMPSKNTGIEDLIKQYNIPNVKNTYYTTEYKKIINAKVIQCGSAVFVESDIKNCDSIKNQLKNINR